MSLSLPSSRARQSTPSAFSSLSQTKRDSGRDGRIKRGGARAALIRRGEDGACLLKSQLSIQACVFSTKRSLILTPFDFTHFIDSPGAPNEMLNLSVAAAGPRGYSYGDRERNRALLFPLPSSLHGCIRPQDSCHQKHASVLECTVLINKARQVGQSLNAAPF